MRLNAYRTSPSRETRQIIFLMIIWPRIYHMLRNSCCLFLTKPHSHKSSCIFFLAFFSLQVVLMSSSPPTQFLFMYLVFNYFQCSSNICKKLSPSLAIHPYLMLSISLHPSYYSLLFSSDFYRQKIFYRSIIWMRSIRLKNF